MNGNGSYKTIKTISEGFYKEKGSKFLSFAYPVKNEADVKQIISDLKKRYFDARHHVYAFRIGPDKKFYRYSDDGEPSNSSGPPVLGQIQSFDLTDILIVVVRYFGGTKLGIPGLFNAYRSAANAAIENAEIVTVTRKRSVEIRFQYSLLGAVMRFVKDEAIEIISRQMSNDCILVLDINETEFERVISKLNDIRVTSISYL